MINHQNGGSSSNFRATKSNSSSNSIAGARSALFGGKRSNDNSSLLPVTVAPSSTNKTHQQQQQQMYAAEVHEKSLEDDIDKRTTELRKGVAMMKEVTLEIRNELQDQNQILGDMHTHMSSAQHSVKEALKKLRGLMDFISTRHICLLTMFVVAVFFVMYSMLKYYYYSK